MHSRLNSPVRSAFVALGLAVVTGACAGATTAASPVPAAPVPAAPAAGSGAAPETPPPLRWPVKTLAHVDLWLHAFAVLSEDSATVPLYRRGYRDSITVVKNQRHLLTALDANRATLEKGLQRTGYLNAQFLPFAFANWEEMRATIEQFLQVSGDPRRAPTREAAMRVQMLASVFTTAADREWLRLFLAGVQDEAARFFTGEHSRLVRERAGTITAVDSIWQQVYRTKFERFLNNTSQRQGDLVLSLPIGGEGRTGPGFTGRPMVAVTWPARAGDAAQVLYVLAHEVTGALVGPAVADNTTPAEQRAGTADRFVATGQVQAGAVLLSRVAPELVVGYQRYYLTQAGMRVSASSSEAETVAMFDKRFALPAVIRSALVRQIDIVLSGI